MTITERCVVALVCGSGDRLMEFGAARKHLLRPLEAVEDFPFGPVVYVYKVAGNMFATLADDGLAQMNLKCDPKEAQFCATCSTPCIPAIT